MEKTLLKYTSLSDQELQKLIWFLIKTTASYRHFQRSKRRQLRTPACITSQATIPRYLSPYSPSTLKHSIEVNSLRPSSLRSTPKSRQTYTIEQLLTLQTIFSKLFDQHSHSDLVRKTINEPGQLNIAAVKQFFLDCYACDAKFFSLVLEPIKGREWVNCEQFVKCFEGIHNGSNWKFFSVKKIKLDEKDNLMKLKLICKGYLVFYCVVMFEKEDDLDREALKKALNMVEKHTNVHLEMLADLYLSKVREANPYGPCKISFRDYYNIIVNS